MLVPARYANETRPLGSPESAERYAMPGIHIDPEPGTNREDAP